MPTRNTRTGFGGRCVPPADEASGAAMLFFSNRRFLRVNRSSADWLRCALAQPANLARLFRLVE